MTEAYPPHMSAPVEAPVVGSMNRSSLFVLIACAVAVGVIMAAGVIWAVSSVVHSGDKEACEKENLTRSITGGQIRDCG